MTGFSTCCRCGPKGAAKHDAGECPHLYHTCGPQCGPNYKAFWGLYAARMPGSEVRSAVCGASTREGDGVTTPCGSAAVAGSPYCAAHRQLEVLYEA